MKKYHVIISAVILAAFPARADVIEIAPSDDSYIRPTFPNQGANFLAIIGDTATPDDFLRALFAFDLAAPELVGATINSASLSLRIVDRDTSGGGSADLAQTLELHQLAASFTNSGVTWTSRNGTDAWTNPGGDLGPAIASLVANAGTVNAADTLTFSSPDLTALVASMVGGSVDLIGKLAVEDANRSIFRIGSQNAPVSENRPRLVIDFTPAAGSPDPQVTAITRAPDGSLTIDFIGAPATVFSVRKSLDLASFPITVTAQNAPVTTAGDGSGQAIINAADATEPRAFFILENP